MESQARRRVQIAIQMMDRMKAPEERRAMVEPVPEVERVVEQQEPEDDSQRLREAEPAKQSEPPPFGQRLNRRHDRQFGRRRRAGSEQADRHVANDAFGSGFALRPQRAQPFHHGERAGRDTEGDPPPARHGTSIIGRCSPLKSASTSGWTSPASSRRDRKRKKPARPARSTSTDSPRNPIGTCMSATK